MKWFNNAIDYIEEKNILKFRPGHLKARLIVSLILLVVSAIGVLITDFAPNFAWTFWRYIIPFYAIICIWLSWHVSRSHKVDKMSILHEILHWIALMIAVHLVAVIVATGIISYLIGALFVLILLALTVFLAGVHFDSMFLIIGVLLGLLAIASVYVVKYLVIIVIPLVAIVALFFIWRFVVKNRAEKHL